MTDDKCEKHKWKEVKHVDYDDYNVDCNIYKCTACDDVKAFLHVQYPGYKVTQVNTNMPGLHVLVGKLEDLLK